MLDSPLAIWKELQQGGGLDLRYHDDMDDEVRETLLGQLGFSQETQIEVALGDPKLTVEHFIGALLRVLNPFSAMMNDLLSLFERAGASRSDDSMHVEFDFERAPKLSFDLRQFRDWIRTTQMIRELIRVHHWSYADLWELNTALKWGNEWGARNTPAERWAFDYLEMRRFGDAEVPVPESGDAELDVLLRRAYEVWSGFVEAAARYSQDRNRLREMGRNARTDPEAGRDEPWPLGFVARVDDDNWAASVAAGMHRVAQGVALSGGDANRVIERLRALFDRVPTMTVESERAVEILRAFLNMPVWRRRHELYSAWVLTQIVKALDSRDLRFHTDKGVLTFSFGGSHLATIVGTRPALHIWAELRSPLDVQSRLSGRKSIQPDYSLVADPITSRNSAVAVVECKQYRRFARGNFSKAVIDYAEGRPGARIILAAYGPVRDDFLSGVDPRSAERIVLIGSLRPGSDTALDRFRREIQSAIEARYSSAPAHPSEESAEVPVSDFGIETITLDWGSQPSDLDLYLAIRRKGLTQSISFHARGVLDDYPFAQLAEDLREGHGPETIRVTRMCEGVYQCYVHNYSGERPLAGCGASVLVTLGGGRSVLVRSPSEGAGAYWHVFDFEAATGCLRVVNRCRDEEPTGAAFGDVV